MSLYREAGRRGRWVPVAIGLALAAGFLAGFLAGRAGDDRPSLPSALERLQRELRPVVEALELAPIEYRQAVRGGRIAAPTEYAAAKEDVGRARDAFAKARADLAALAPEGARRAEAELAQLAALVGRRAEAGAVTAQAGRTERTIKAGARLP